MKHVFAEMAPYVMRPPANVLAHPAGQVSTVMTYVHLLTTATNVCNNVNAKMAPCVITWTAPVYVRQDGRERIVIPRVMRAIMDRGASRFVDVRTMPRVTQPMACVIVGLDMLARSVRSNVLVSYCSD